MQTKNPIISFVVRGPVNLSEAFTVCVFRLSSLIFLSNPNSEQCLAYPYDCTA